jgi:hypothetical protein
MNRRTSDRFPAGVNGVMKMHCNAAIFMAKFALLSVVTIDEKLGRSPSATLRLLCT